MNVGKRGFREGAAGMSVEMSEPTAEQAENDPRIEEQQKQGTETEDSRAWITPCGNDAPKRPDPIDAETDAQGT